MSAVGDVLGAFKNVLLLQERMSVMERTLDQLARNVDGLNEYAVSIDKRVVRIETMIEMTTSRGGQPPRIEG
jgi:hypothetical protein